MKKRLAFTLAEVIIVISIIGVVAQATIIPLVKNFQDQVYKVSYKKAFSIATQAWTQAVTDGNILERPSWGDGATRVSNFNAFKSYFKVRTDCNSADNSQCWAVGEYFFSLLPVSSASAFIDNSGVAWSIDQNGDGAGPEILIDTNGLKKPNKYGQDRFIFYPATIDNADTGLAVKIMPYPDFISKDIQHCLSGDTHPCYFTSWLIGDK